MKANEGTNWFQQQFWDQLLLSGTWIYVLLISWTNHKQRIQIQVGFNFWCPNRTHLAKVQPKVRVIQKWPTLLGHNPRAKVQSPRSPSTCFLCSPTNSRSASICSHTATFTMCHTIHKMLAMKSFQGLARSVKMTISYRAGMLPNLLKDVVDTYLTLTPSQVKQLVVSQNTWYNVSCYWGWPPWWRIRVDR